MAWVIWPHPQKDYTHNTVYHSPVRVHSRPFDIWPHPHNGISNVTTPTNTYTCTCYKWPLLLPKLKRRSSLIHRKDTRKDLRQSIQEESPEDLIKKTSNQRQGAEHRAQEVPFDRQLKVLLVMKDTWRKMEIYLEGDEDYLSSYIIASCKKLVGLKKQPRRYRKPCTCMEEMVHGILVTMHAIHIHIWMSVYNIILYS